MQEQLGSNLKMNFLVPWRGLWVKPKILQCERQPKTLTQAGPADLVWNARRAALWLSARCLTSPHFSFLTCKMQLDVGSDSCLQREHRRLDPWSSWHYPQPWRTLDKCWPLWSWFVNVVRITITIVIVKAIFRREESYIDVQPAAAKKT